VWPASGVGVGTPAFLPRFSNGSQAAKIASLDTSIFAFPTDFRDEGTGAVLDNVQHRAGLGGVTLATVYHEARDLFPHNPRGKVRFLEGGVAYFRPDPARYRGLPLEPRPALLVEGGDVLAELVTATERRGLAVHAWTVFLHSDWVREPRPEFAERNAFGDPLLTELCPANPAVRDYVRALTGDIASRGVRTIVAESLHYHPLEHGFHHERYFLELGPRARFMLGLCFCDHCLAVAREHGADGDAVRRYASDELERAFSGVETDDAEELTLASVQGLAGGELGGYLDARTAVVTSLAAEAAEAAASEGARFAFMDASGATKGYATGRPEGDPAPAIAWQLGVDLAAVARVCGGIEAIAYAADPKRIRLDLEAYGALLTDSSTLAAALRPMPPDCDSPANLAAKLRLAHELGLERVDFYHYGLAPLTALDLIHAALDAV
jgi:hypothetical protein